MCVFDPVACVRVQIGLIAQGPGCAGRARHVCSVVCVLFPLRGHPAWHEGASGRVQNPSLGVSCSLLPGCLLGRGFSRSAPLPFPAAEKNNKPKQAQQVPRPPQPSRVPVAGRPPRLPAPLSGALAARSHVGCRWLRLVPELRRRVPERRCPLLGAGPHLSAWKAPSPRSKLSAPRFCSQVPFCSKFAPEVPST